MVTKEIWINSNVWNYIRAVVVTPTQLIDNNIYLDIKKYISEYSFD